MNKRTVIFLMILIMTSVLLAQQGKIEVQGIKTLTMPQEGPFFFPKLTPDGERVLFSGPRFYGLYLMDLRSGKMETLNRDNGAGYEYQINNDGQYVLYRSIQFLNKRKYYTLKKQNLNTKKIQIIERDVRDLTPPRIVQNRALYLKNGQPQMVEIIPSLQKQKTDEVKSVFIQNRKIVLITDGDEKILTPLGEGIYIWPRLSPDGQRIVFTYAGDATYICDLDGNILAKIGYANAPVWSSDGKWIAYMVDHDDGERFTDSDIFVSSADGKEKFRITNTPNVIEMYPNWGSRLSKLVFASNKGQIFLATLKIEQ